MADIPLERDSLEKGASGQRDSNLVPGSTSSLGKDSAVKESTSAGQGTGVTSRDSPSAVSGRPPPPIL